MKKTSAWIMIGLLILPGLVALTACSAAEPQKAETVEEATAKAQADQRQRMRARPPVRTTRNLYEGSLWRGAASWGNLMRDHRARYRGDLLTVREVARIIKVPEPTPETPAPTPVALQQQQGQNQNQEAQAQPQQREDPVLAYLRELEKRRKRVEQEQNDILRSIESIEVQVYRVLPNGNLLVRGNHPPIFRDQNRVKYLVSLQGVVRPSDVDDNNSIPAPKLNRAEYKIRRLVRRAAAVAGEVAAIGRAVGAQREAEFVERVSDAAIGGQE